MKTSVWGKSILALVFTFMCSLAISAASPKDYLYDTKEENGKIISKVVFLQENGLLNKQVRYEFQYNENGKVSEKKAFRGIGQTTNGFHSIRSLINMMIKVER